MFSMSIQDQVGPGLEAIIANLGRDLAARRVNAVVGRAAAQLTRDHLYALANQRHRAGVGQNFYEDAGDAVSNEDLGNAVLIRIDKTGVAQRYHGGRIERVNKGKGPAGDKLWIPIAGSEAEGRAPGEFPDLTVIVSALTGKGVAMKGDEVLFALVKSVTQDPDPSVLPTPAEYTQVAISAISDVAAEAFERSKPPQAGRDSQGRFIKGDS